jgi:hypothetical protein
MKSFNRLFFLSFFFSVGLACSAWANNSEDLAAKGFRWVTVNGPYACPTQEEVRQITDDDTDANEFHMVEDGSAYYLVPGTLVQIVQDDLSNGMSEIIMRGITRSLWTYTRFLSTAPVYDTYGIIETPQTNGLIDPRDDSRLHVPNFEATPAPGISPDSQSGTK